MATVALIDHRTLGEVVLERLAEMNVPASLTSHVTAFKSAHTAFEKAAVVAEAAKKKRDEALTLIGNADTELDATIDPLADRMIGAGLGTRRSAFGDASPHSPTKLKALPYQKEVDAVRDLVSNVRAKKPPASVKECLDASSKASDEAIKALSGPQAAYDRARGARDQLLVAWSRTFAKLRINAKAAWHEEPETFASIFAPPEKVQRPVTRKKKAKKPTEKSDK